MKSLNRHAQTEGISPGTLAGRLLAEAALALPPRQGLSSGRSSPCTPQSGWTREVAPASPLLCSVLIGLAPIDTIYGVSLLS